MSAHDALLKLAERIEKLSASAPLIMYHGTRATNIPSILSQGLIPNPKQRAWHTDNDAGWHSASRVSLDGVYLTTNLMTAIGSASNGPQQRGKTAGLVIVEIHPNSLVADEDDFKYGMEALRMEGYNPGPLHAAQMYFDYLVNGETGEHFSSSRDSWIKKQMESLDYQAQHKMNLNLKARMEEILKKGFIFVLKRKCAYSDDYTWRQAWSYVSNDRNKPVPEMISKDEAEQGFLQFSDIVTRAAKRAFHSDESAKSTRYTARSLNPIRYNGKSKILAVLEIDNRYKDDEPTGIHVAYPSSWNKIPQRAVEDFLKQYKERYGGDYKIINKD